MAEFFKALINAIIAIFTGELIKKGKEDSSEADVFAILSEAFNNLFK